MRRFLFLLCFCALFSLVSAKEEIKMGAIWSMTGPLSFLGEQMRDGALLRMQELEDEETLFDYNLIFEDDSGAPSKTVLAYKKVTSVDNVDVVFSAWAGPGNAVAPLAAHDKVFTIGCSWDDSTANDPLAFVHLTPPPPQAKLLAKTLKYLEYEKVGVLCMVQQGFMAMADSFDQYGEQEGLSIKTVKFNPGEKDFRSHLLKLRSFDPDIFVVLTFNPDFEIAVRRIKESYPDTPITAVEGFSYTNDLTPYAGNFFIEGNYPTDEFKQMFVAATGKPLASIGYNAIAYDLVDFTIYAFESAGKKLGRKPTNAEAAEILRGLRDYQSAIGPVWSNDKGVFHSPAVLKYIQEDGQTQVLNVEQLQKKLQLH